MAAKKNFYAVRNGRTPGIYRTWAECQQAVAGFSRAQFKGFSTREEAEAFMRGDMPQTKGPAAGPKPKLFENGDSGTRDGAAAEMPNVPGRAIIYADGACTGNPGPGGYGVVILSGGERQELSGGYRRTTNNRMEILGCIEGLKSVSESDVAVYSDSRYVVNAMTQSWAVNWRRRGWKRRTENGELAPAANADLWAEMLDVCEGRRVSFNWVRGHDGNVENERCDYLARTAAARADLKVDRMYENGINGTD